MRDTLIFHVHLVQDVAALRPLIRLAKRLHHTRDVMVLCAEEFIKLDATGLWRDELGLLCAELDIPVKGYASPWDAVCMLADRRGLIVAGSESDQRNHIATHALFRALPPRWLRVSVQHGFECVGLLHNAAHDRAAGRVVRFAADLVAVWFPERRLHTVTARERPKLYLAGPQMMIEAQHGTWHPADPLEGLICENLHSVRFAQGEARKSFIDDFNAFARRLESLGSRLHLRPHPAGNFTQRNNLALPQNVELSTVPLHRLTLSDIAYCISAPSTIIFDFVLAGVPVAVWRDAEGRIDTTNFKGLTEVVTKEDWWRFVARIAVSPTAVLECQSAFVSGLDIPSDIEGRYARLLSLG